MACGATSACSIRMSAAPAGVRHCGFTGGRALIQDGLGTTAAATATERTSGVHSTAIRGVRPTFYISRLWASLFCAVFVWAGAVTLAYKGTESGGLTWGTAFRGSTAGRKDTVCGPFIPYASFTAVLL